MSTERAEVRIDDPVRMISTRLPAGLTDHLEREWPDRQRVGVANTVSPEYAASNSELLDHVERDLRGKLDHELGERGLVLIGLMGPSWTTWDRLGQPELEPGPSERPWVRGTPLPQSTWCLVCRINGVAIAPWPEPEFRS